MKPETIKEPLSAEAIAARLAGGLDAEPLDGQGQAVSQSRLAVHGPQDHEHAGTVLNEVVAFLRQYLSLPEGMHDVVALWAAHTYLYDLFDQTPRLAFLSPEPGCGKTRALELLEFLCANPRRSDDISVAALARMVGKGTVKTFLADEVDTVFKPKSGDRADDLKRFINSGYRQGGMYTRCVGEGTNQSELDFHCFAPVAMAAIGFKTLPDAVETRSLKIEMQRRAPGETLRGYRQKLVRQEAEPLAERLSEWATSIREEIVGAWPEMPPGVEDRAADNWLPLLAIADAAGGEWPARARSACTALTRSRSAEPTNMSTQLLHDLREVCGRRGGRVVTSQELVDGLRGLDDGPWEESEWGKPLDKRALAKRLKVYGIKSGTKWLPGGQTAKGYELADLQDAFGRYLDTNPDVQPDGHLTDAQRSDLQPDACRSLTDTLTERDRSYGDQGFFTSTPPMTADVPRKPPLPSLSRQEPSGVRIGDCDLCLRTSVRLNEDRVCFFCARTTEREVG